MGRYLGPARNGVWGTSGDLKLVCNEAVPSRGGDLASTSPPSFLETCTFASTATTWRTANGDSSRM